MATAKPDPRLLQRSWARHARLGVPQRAVADLVASALGHWTVGGVVNGNGEPSRTRRGGGGGPIYVCQM